MEKNTKNVLMGFERYIQLDWCIAALEAANERQTVSEVKEQLAKVLTGVESKRKTFDILKRLWLQPLPNYAEFSKRGVALYRKHGADAVVPLNWGIAIVTYPFFGKTAEITGRLLSLQGDCSIKEVQRRMAEIYGDRDGIVRAVSRVLQSQESWRLIERVEKGKRLVRKTQLTLSEEEIITWLIEAVIRYTGKAVSLANLQSMPVLYPFVMDQSLAYAVSSNKKLELRSEGANGHFVALRD